MVLGIAHIEALQLFGPILCLGATCTCIDLENAVHVVFFALKHIFQLDVLKEVHRLLILLVNLLFAHQILLVEFEGCGKFIDIRLDIVIGLDPRTDALNHLHLFLGFLLVVPESGHLGAKLLLFELDLLVFDVEITVQVGQTVLCGLQLFYRNHSKISICWYNISKNVAQR